MKFQLKQLILLFALPVILFGEAADHLIFKRITITPKEAEMVVIHNPTNQDIPLGNYYITDAVSHSSSEYYYKLPSGIDFWSGSASDFIARFPDTTLAAGDDLILGLHNDTFYSGYYSEVPDLTLFDDMLNAVEGETTISISVFSANYPNMILSSSEVLILFHWDGNSPTVQDVDYFLWGDNNSLGIDKSGISNYLDDTPIDQQSYYYTHGNDSTYLRISLDEAGESQSAGNGITNHDETSENVLESWNVVLDPMFVYGCTDLTAPNYNPDANREDGSCLASIEDLTPLSDIYNGEHNAGESLIVQGLVVEFADVRPSNGPQSITIEDSEGYRISLTVWDWDVASSIVGPMIDPYNPSQYVIQASGILDLYNGNYQLEILASTDIVMYSVYHLEGEVVFGDVIDATIEPAPYVIIPSLGERLDFTYSFPSNSRVVVRIFDLSGRFVTSLVDRYFEQSGSVYRQEDNSDWDGRDHLGQIVPPGTYFMNIETNNFSTGKTSMDTAPVVVGVKF